MSLERMQYGSLEHWYPMSRCFPSRCNTEDEKRISIHCALGAEKFRVAEYRRYEAGLEP